MGYQLIQTIEVGSGGAASIEFTGIPQDRVSLLLVYSARNTGNSNYAFITFNNDNTSVYDNLRLSGDGSSALSVAINRPYLIPFTVAPSGSTAYTFGNAELYISKYTSSSQKVISQNGVGENNASSAAQYLSADSYTNSAAISSIKIASGNGVLAVFSTASLYSIS
jgi:hypothetical protein